MTQQKHEQNARPSAKLAGRRGYVLAATGALFVVVVAMARFAPPANVVVMEEAVVAEPVTELVDEAAPDAAAGDEVTTELAPADSPAMQSASPDQLFGFPAITDGVPRVTKPAAVRGLYLNAWAAGSPQRLDRLIGIARSTEINTFVIDVKEGGEVSYRSRVPLVREIGADREYIGDVRGMLRKLRENGIYPIARIVVFKDGVLAKARPDWAVQHQNGGDWIDNDGYRWVDSYNRNVWEYNIAIAREALELGFSEVQWDYVRFPDVPSALMRTALWPAQEGRSKADGIRDFLLHSRERLASFNVPITADVFGLTTSVRTDMGIGQLWEKMSDATDVLLPMVYPSHYARGSYGIAHPNAQPYETIKTALEHGVKRSAGIANAASIRPWLQDFTLGQPRYGPAHVRAQIDAVYDAGLEEWVLWHPGSNYTVAALATADGVAPQLPRPTGAEVSAPAQPQRRRGPLGTPIAN
jgi:hypothetical protein